MNPYPHVELGEANDSPIQRQLKEKVQLGGIEAATSIRPRPWMAGQIMAEPWQLLDATWHLVALARLCVASRTTGKRPEAIARRSDFTEIRLELRGSNPASIGLLVGCSKRNQYFAGLLSVVAWASLAREIGIRS